MPRLFPRDMRRRRERVMRSRRLFYGRQPVGRHGPESKTTRMAGDPDVSNIP